MPRRVTPRPAPEQWPRCRGPAGGRGIRGPECTARVWWAGDHRFVRRRPPGEAVVGGPSRCFGFKGREVRAIMPLMARPSRRGPAARPAAGVGEADLRRDSNGAGRTFTPCQSPSGEKGAGGRGGERAWGAGGRVNGYWRGAAGRYGRARRLSLAGPKMSQNETINQAVTRAGNEPTAFLTPSLHLSRGAAAPPQQPTPLERHPHKGANVR